MKRPRTNVNGGLSMRRARTLGRLASEIAQVLRGKHKPSFTPNVDSGDFVIVVNCDKFHVTGNRLDDKRYYRHSRYPGGLKSRTMREQLDRQPQKNHL